MSEGETLEEVKFEEEEWVCVEFRWVEGGEEAEEEVVYGMVVVGTRSAEPRCVRPLPPNTIG